MKDRFLLEAEKARIKFEEIELILGKNTKRRDENYLVRRKAELEHYRNVYFALVGLAGMHARGEVPDLLKELRPSRFAISSILKKPLTQISLRSRLGVSGELDYLSPVGVALMAIVRDVREIEVRQALVESVIED